MTDNYSMETFTNRLFNIMEIRGITQKQLKDLTGINQSTIALWKSRGTIPKADDAIRVAEVLNVSVEYLVFGKSKIEDLSDRIYKLKEDQIEVIMSIVKTFENQNKSN